MKRIAFRIPHQQDRAVIVVDDADAARFKVEYWLARINKGHLEIYRNAGSGVMLMLGRELLGIKEFDVCVTHRNDDEKDYRRSNLMPISRKAHTQLLKLINPGRPVGSRLEFCKRGHPLTDSNRKSNGKSSSICRKCSAMRNKRSYEIRKALKA